MSRANQRSLNSPSFKLYVNPTFSYIDNLGGWVLIEQLLGGDLHKNNPFMKEMHKITSQPNYFNSLTLLCGAYASGDTHLACVVCICVRGLQLPTWKACVTPMAKTPHYSL
jgi:hypothetical protein